MVLGQGTAWPVGVWLGRDGRGMAWDDSVLSKKSGVRHVQTVFAYLRILPDGTFELAVSTTALNVIGTRLEKGHKVFPEAVRSFVADPTDQALAVAALRAVQGFLDGTEAGFNPPEFGGELPKVRRK